MFAMIMFFVFLFVVVPLAFVVITFMIRAAQTVTRWVRKTFQTIIWAHQAHVTLHNSLAGKTSTDPLESVKKDFISAMFDTECSTQVIESSQCQEQYSFLEDILMNVRKCRDVINKSRVLILIPCVVALAAVSCMNGDVSRNTVRNLLNGHVFDNDVVMIHLCESWKLVDGSIPYDSDERWRVVTVLLRDAGYPFKVRHLGTTVGRDGELIGYDILVKGLGRSFTCYVSEKK